ncbi:MAG: response regulator, partial [Lentisphaeria bacterium]
MPKETILIIEDDDSIRELLKITLEGQGFRIIMVAADGETGLQLAKSHQPDLILLDLMLPGISGVDVCRNLKSQPDLQNIPIIMLTAKSEEADIVLGLELGACDYVTKPFSNKVLVSRIRAQLRRLTEKSDANEVRHGSLLLNRSERNTLLDGRQLELTFSEFELLWLLASHPSRVYTRQQIVLRIKGDNYPVTERAV